MDETVAILAPQVRRNVYLHGFLGERYGHKWEFDARATRTVGDIVRAIEAHDEKFARDLMRAHEDGIGFGLKAGEREISEAELTFPLGGQDLHIVPVPLSAKGAGWGMQTSSTSLQRPPSSALQIRRKLPGPPARPSSPAANSRLP